MSRTMQTIIAWTIFTIVGGAAIGMLILAISWSQTFGA